MLQSREQLRSTFDRLRSLAERRTWVPGEDAPIGLHLTTIDPPKAVPFEAVESFVHYVREAHRVDLSLAGGGYGCFDLGFIAGADGAESLKEALADDSRVQDALNRMGMHDARLNTPR